MAKKKAEKQTNIGDARVRYSERKDEFDIAFERYGSSKLPRHVHDSMRLRHISQKEVDVHTYRGNFAMRLQAMRLRAGLSQIEVGAALVDMNLLTSKGAKRGQQSVQHYESGGRFPTLPILSGLCGILRCEPNDLVPPMTVKLR